MTYLVDSNVLIEAKNRYYSFDVCPAFWDWLVQGNARGRVYSVRRVQKELVDRADELSNWVKRNPEMFLDPDSSVMEQLSHLSEWAKSREQYTSGAIAQFLSSADYYLIAHAKACGSTVVTHERPEPQSRKKIKIPDVCNAFRVEWTNPYAMLRNERARFRLDGDTQILESVG